MADVVHSRTFTEHEALLAKAAMRRAGRNVAHSMGRLLNPVAWAKVRPWTMLGVSALTGIAAGAVVASPPPLTAQRRAKIGHRLRQGRGVLRSILAIAVPMFRFAVSHGLVGRQKKAPATNGHPHHPRHSSDTTDE